MGAPNGAALATVGAIAGAKKLAEGAKTLGNTGGKTTN